MLTGHSPTDLAYAAGIVDGEGSVGAHLKLGSHYGRKGNLLRVWVSISNSDFELTRWFKETFGGEWGVIDTPHRRSHPHWKPMSYWKLSGAKAGDFLESIYPYMRVKREQADVAIALAGLLMGNTGEARWHGIPQDNLEARAMLVEELRLLNDNRRRRARSKQEEVA